METQQQQHYRYVVLGFCLIVTLLNYFDRTVIAYAIAPIKHDLSLNNTQFGLLMSAFAVGCVSINGIAGVLVDKYTPRLIWTIGVVFWSIIMILLGVVHPFWLFLVLRYLLGVGEGVNFPTLDRALLDWFEPKNNSLVLGISLLGVPLAGFIGSPILSQIIITYDWRNAFIILGVAGLILVGIWQLLLAYYRYPEQPFWYNNSKEEKPYVDVPFKLLIKNPTIISISWAFFAFGYVLFFGVTWLPGYLEATYHLHLSKIGLFLMLPWGISCVLIVLGGYLSDYAYKKTNNLRFSRVYILCICESLAIVFFIIPIVIHSLWIALFSISFAIGLALMPNAIYYSICSDITRQKAGTATGLMITCFSLSGIVSPVLTGWLTEIFGGFDAAIGALIVVVASAIIGLLIFAKPDEHAITT